MEKSLATRELFTIKRNVDTNRTIFRARDFGTILRVTRIIGGRGARRNVLTGRVTLGTIIIVNAIVIKRARSRARIDR